MNLPFPKPVAAALVIALVVGVIVYIELNKPEQTSGTAVELAQPMNEGDKAKMFTSAKELANPAGFINTEAFRLGDLIGEQIILVDFWTYSCINCQRTLPYLNDWHEKYGDMGLTIVGVHTPEFEFEQQPENVQQAVDKFGIKYPVVLDNEYATWRAYGNRYWPRKYLIDIDGFIVYDHIGEGSYQETEAKIQELLAERAERLGTSAAAEQPLSVFDDAPTRSDELVSPEVYFGSARNELLGNGRAGVSGVQELSADRPPQLNELQLLGSWNVQPEFAQSADGEATIRFRYRAKDVYMVAASAQPVTAQVLIDGQPVQMPGADVQQGTVTIQDEQLYHLIADDDVGVHTLELKIPESGLQAFTFTFG